VTETDATAEKDASARVLLYVDSSAVEYADLPEETVDRQRARAARYPSSVAAQVGYATALAATGRYSEAISALRKVASQGPNDQIVQARLADFLAANGETEAAEAEFVKLSSIGNVDALIGLARLRVQQERFDDALDLWQRASELDPTRSIARFGKGLTYLALGDNNQAVHELREVVRSRPRSSTAHQALGIAYSASRLSQKALIEFEAALALAPNLESAAVGMAHALIAQGREGEALGLLLKLKPSTAAAAGAYELLGFARYRNGEHRLAIRALEQAVEALSSTGAGDSDQAARIWNNIGVCWSRLRSARKAEDAYKEAIALAPSQPIPYYNLIRLCVHEGRTDEALLVVDHGIERFPDDDILQLLRVYALERAGRPEAAVELLESWVASANAPVDVFAALGKLLTDDTQNIGRAIIHLEDGLRRFPNEPLLQNNLAYALLCRGDVTEAAEILHQASPNLAVDDDRAQTAKVLLTATNGLLEIKLGNLEAGAALYQAAADLAEAQRMPALAGRARQKMHLELGRALIDAGDADSARRQLKQGQRTGDDLTYRREINDLLKALPKGEDQERSP
jgi:tetratricopeptide (TPR) repeat protein